MPRVARVAPGGLIYHVLNRSVAGLPLFRKEKDYEAFQRIVIEAQEVQPIGVLAWRLMRTHWHFVVWPQEDGDVTAHFRWLAEKEAGGVRTCITRNRPYGSETWQCAQAKRLGLLHTTRGERRPKAIQPKPKN
ncbi:MAG: hypothetical protein ACLP9L_26680 [Thermoguttaceae bacterium]